jgi:hypothetical protein
MTTKSARKKARRITLKKQNDLGKIRKIIGGFMNCNVEIKDPESSDTVQDLAKDKFDTAIKTYIKPDSPMNPYIYQQVNSVVKTIAILVQNAVKDIMNKTLESKKEQLRHIILNYITYQFYNIKWADDKYYKHSQKPIESIIYQHPGNVSKTQPDKLFPTNVIDIYLKELDNKDTIKLFFMNCFKKEKIETSVSSLFEGGQAENSIVSIINNNIETVAPNIVPQLISDYENINKYTKSQIQDILSKTKVSV